MLLQEVPDNFSAAGSATLDKLLARKEVIAVAERYVVASAPL
ncbi:hypothetical protein [Rubripirellula amarantea]|nr:hypothetical protein [Rubripirellula amarantea]